IYRVNGSPIDNISANTSKSKSLFPVKLDKNELGVIWQDIHSMNIHLTRIKIGINNVNTSTLTNPNKGYLLAASANERGDLYYATVQDRENEPTSLVISRYDIMTRKHISSELKTAQHEIDIYKQYRDVASMIVKEGIILLALSRTHHKSNDGLHHQSGTSLIIDAKTLNFIRNNGITTSHCFDNVVTADINNDFITVEMGDAYPRGLNFRRFNKTTFNSEAKSVYTYKTLHSNTADCFGIKTFPQYLEISTPNNKYYKWSNDNNTYTEIGNVIDTKDGYILSFLGEPDSKGYSLNNKWYGGNNSRNVGYVKLSRDFFNKGSDGYLSKGINETGGFYDFWGNWNVQNNYGVVWLTKYSNSQNAKFLKTVMLKDGKILFIWELWDNGAYVNTSALRLDKNGNQIGTIMNLGTDIRLDHKNDILYSNAELLFFTGLPNESSIGITVLKLK
ncbi:MAG: hypothetical protein ACO30P_09045, partial [Candidatus Kapaibacteriota bacterium]